MTATTLADCYAAVQRDGMALQAIDATVWRQHMPEICLMAVNQNGMALQFIKNQTHALVATRATEDDDSDPRPHYMHDICLAAVSQNGMAIQFVKEWTYDICLAAVKNCGFAIEMICMNMAQGGDSYADWKHNIQELCRVAYASEPDSLALIPKGLQGFLLPYAP